jgi:hypothetical protein
MPFAPGFRNAQRDYPLIAHTYRTVFHARDIGGLFKMWFPGFLSRGALERLFFVGYTLMSPRGFGCPRGLVPVPAVLSPSPRGGECPRPRPRPPVPIARYRSLFKLLLNLIGDIVATIWYQNEADVMNRLAIG